MKKKIVLTGVALILLILIGVDIYRDHKRADDRRNLQTTVAPTDNSAASGMAAATPMTNDMSGANNVTQEPVASTTTTTRQHRRVRHHSAATPDDESLADNTPDQGEMTLTDDQAETAPVSVETSREYTGNVPKPVPAVAVQQKKVVTDEAHPRRMVHFGPEIGIMDNSYNNVHMQNMDRTGFKAGGIVDFRLSDHFGIQSGIMYELKGEETHNVNSNDIMQVDAKDKFNLNYLEVPLDFIVKIGDPKEGQLMIGAGPYIAYLLSARDRNQTTTTNFDLSNGAGTGVATASRTTDNLQPGGITAGNLSTEENSSIPIGNEQAGTTSLRSLDWGINGFIGCQLPGGFYAKGGTEVGMMNIQHNADGSNSAKNMNFFLSVGYLLGYRK